MKLIDSIKEEHSLFETKLQQNDLQYMMNSEKTFIRHLSWINSILADLAHSKKLLSELGGKKKLKAKELRERNELVETVNQLEAEVDFLNEDKKFVQNLMLKASKLLWEEYSSKDESSHSFEEIIQSEKNLKYYFNNGIINTYKLRFVPKILGDDIKNAFPAHPRNEFLETRQLHRHFYIHEGGTNSGKTYTSIMRLGQAESGLYLAPLRLLALEIYDRLNNDGVYCNLKTGEEEIIIASARHTSSTVEKVDLSREYEVAVIDEAQMLSDLQRGAAWTRALLGVRAREVHVCCALYATPILKTLIEDCNDTYEVITHVRDTELIMEDSNFNFPASVKEADALIVFSRKSVLTAAAALEERKIPCSVIYGSLPPETRRMQFEKFLSKENKVLVSTDAIGMGVNLPIKRVVFLEKDKFDGIDVRSLLSSEIKQIAGRAGRKGIYDVGYINTIYLESKKYLSDALVSYEEPITKAYLAPTEDILKVGGDLETKLKVWASIDPEESFYVKINVDRLIQLINIIKSMGCYKKLSEADVFKCITIPFDEGEDELLYLWKDYIRVLSSNTNEIFKPSYNDEELLQLEIYYRKIDLYYSFSKTFNFDMDEDWVKSERGRISKLIDKHLKERIKRYRKSCKVCGAPLNWNHMYQICDRCYSLKLRDRLDYDFDEYPDNNLGDEDFFK